MFNQALGLPVHFCHELSILLFAAWFARRALVRLRWLAALNRVVECLVVGIELFVVAFELLMLAFTRRAFILPGLVRETLRAALPA